MLKKHVAYRQVLFSRLFLRAETKKYPCGNENFKTLFSGFKIFSSAFLFFRWNFFSYS